MRPGEPLVRRTCSSRRRRRRRRTVSSAVSAPGRVPLAIRFPHARRPGFEEIGSLLRCEPEFGGSATEIVFDEAVLDARVPTADATHSSFECSIGTSPSEFATSRRRAPSPIRAQGDRRLPAPRGPLDRRGGEAPQYQRADTPRGGSRRSSGRGSAIWSTRSAGRARHPAGLRCLRPGARRAPRLRGGHGVLSSVPAMDRRHSGRVADARAREPSGVAGRLTLVAAEHSGRVAVASHARLLDLVSVPADRLGSQESSWAGLEGARPTSRFHAELDRDQLPWSLGTTTFTDEVLVLPAASLHETCTV